MKNPFITALKKAQLGHYAIGHFNTNNLETSQAIFLAANERKSPAIIALSESAIAYGGSELVKAIQELIYKSKVPLILHLDHGRSLEIIKQAIKWQFNSVMIDGSSYSFNKNVQVTKEVVKMARRQNIGVEAEIGTIGGNEDGVRHKGIEYPNPDRVAEFASLTKVDALAVGLGTSHGLPVPKEHVEHALLQEIGAKTEVPIVLHGASNLPSITIKTAIRKGICKINIDTEIRQSFTNGVREVLKNKDVYDIRAYLGFAREETTNIVMEKIKLFGSSNKA